VKPRIGLAMLAALPIVIFGIMDGWLAAAVVAVLVLWIGLACWLINL